MRLALLYREQISGLGSLGQSQIVTKPVDSRFSDAIKRLEAIYKTQISGLGGALVNELDQLVSTIGGWSATEHDDDGRHTNITADSLVVAGDVTIEGDLVVEGTSTLGPIILSGFTPGSVLFAGPAGLISQDNANFFWDDANNRLGIGTKIPAQKLQINGTQVTVAALIANENLLSLNKAANAPTQEMNALFGLEKFLADNNSNTQLNILLRNASSELNIMSLRSNGTVGIGTTSPYANLQIALVTDPMVQITDTSPEGSAKKLQLSYVTAANYGRIQAIHEGSAFTPLSLNPGGGNVTIGTVAFPGVGSAVLVFADGTAPSSLGSNTAALYGDDFGGTVAMRGINEAGDLSQLTPGFIPIPRDKAPGSFTVQTGRYIVTTGLTLSGSEVATLQGTAKWVIV